MELLTLKITPKSAFSTMPKGDTIFGQILSYLFLDNDDTFKEYLSEKPKLVVSDMMPFGYVYRPTLPLECFKSNEKQEVDKKKVRKQNFISLDDLQNGRFYKCVEVDYMTKQANIKNSINRLTFTTDGEGFAPYSTEEITFKTHLWMFVLVDECIKDKIYATIKKIGLLGYGKDGNVGKGLFDVEMIECAFEKFETSYYMSISPTILSRCDVKYAWYEPLTRFGKFGLDKVSKNPFKRPVIMADSSAVIKIDKNVEYIGRAVNNGYEDKPSFLQGYSIAIPIKDEKCPSIN